MIRKLAHTLLLAALLMPATVLGQSRFERMFTSPADYAVPEPAIRGDIIFNELMPFVTSDHSRFIELLNCSPKYIDLVNIYIANAEPDGSTSHEHPLSTESLLLPPGGYVVLASDTARLHCPRGVNPEALYIVTPLPLFSSIRHALVLFDRVSREQIDRVTYSLKWHSPAIADRHNVSLERISPIRPTQDSLNWHSAASTAGYQTAGWPNSQSLVRQTAADTAFFSLSSTIFSPDNDGHDDYLVIRYFMPSEGWLLRATVYTRSGAPVSTVYDGLMLARRGTLTYDGRSHDGAETLPTGLYVLRLEATHPGEVPIIENLVFIKSY